MIQVELEEDSSVGWGVGLDIWKSLIWIQFLVSLLKISEYSYTSFRIFTDDNSLIVNS